MTRRGTRASRLAFVSHGVTRLWLAALLVLATAACSPGLSGHAYVRQSDGSIGPTIASVVLSFVKEDWSAAFAATTDAHGGYSISLPAGRYYVLASHVDYEDYASAPGFSVVSGSTTGTANYFLREPLITTVLIVRHGEKQDPNSDAQNEPLSADGRTRASGLKDTLLRAGVTAVYSTDTVRRTEGAEPANGARPG